MVCDVPATVGPGNLDSGGRELITARKQVAPSRAATRDGDDGRHVLQKKQVHPPLAARRPPRLDHPPLEVPLQHARLGVGDLAEIANNEVDGGRYGYVETSHAQKG